jgi:carboxymethylenebutenolidase
MGQTVQFTRPDGQAVSGYLAEPANAVAAKTAPGIVVIQEWWGMNDQIRGVADRLAAQGYRALVPDLYRGKSTVEAEEANHLMTNLNFGDAAGQDVRGAVQHLKATGSAKVGVTGFCMGGALTLLAAVHVPEVDAAVVWYGYPPLEFVDAGRIKAPLQGHFANQDEFFKIAGVDALENKLMGAKVAFDFHRYDAQHAFANETQVEGAKLLPVLGYDAAAAKLAWQRTDAFFAEHLR